tara:strand:+ start:915 stop:1172 length:258 start_codon:yes stop_codon:yes gene_type:complete
MPLSAAIEPLIADIENAYKTARDEGAKTGADSDGIITTLATELSEAIDKYTKSALVVTTGQTGTQQTAPGGNMVPQPTTGTGELT